MQFWQIKVQELKQATGRRPGIQEGAGPIVQNQKCYKLNSGSSDGET